MRHGVSFTCTGGAKRQCVRDLRGMSLHSVAELAKSWCFEEATIGVAALNAYFAQKDRLDSLNAAYDAPVELPDGTIRKMDAFELYRPRIVEAPSKNVTVIGHFPMLNALPNMQASRYSSAGAPRRSTRPTPPANTCFLKPISRLSRA